MGKVVLVGGSAHRAGPVRAALAALECTVVTAEHGALLDACETLGPASVDAYVQLPVDIEPAGSTVVARIHDFLEQGLLARFEDVTTVFSALRPGASVVLVSGNQPADSAGPDDYHARLALLRVLGHAVLADAANRKLRVVVVDQGRSIDDIARVVVEGPRDLQRMIADLAESNPQMNYNDWRLEVLQLASIES